MSREEDRNFFMVNNQEPGKKYMLHGYTYRLRYNNFGRQYLECITEGCDVNLLLRTHNNIPIEIQRKNERHNHKRNAGIVRFSNSQIPRLLQGK